VYSVLYRVAETSNPLPNLMQSYWKPVDEARFSPLEFECKRSTGIFSVGIKYSMRNIVTSSITVFEAAIWVGLPPKVNVYNYDKIVIENME